MMKKKDLKLLLLMTREEDFTIAKKAKENIKDNER